MAEQLPQFQDTQPILQAQNVNSKASGYEAFAKTLGAIAGTAETKLEDIQKEQSQAMFIHSAAQMSRISTDAQIDMLQHPEQASQILEHTKSLTDQINTNAYVNDKDRQKLGYFASQEANKLSIDAARTNLKQAQLMAAYTHYESWPDQLRAYQEAVIQGSDNADNLKEGMLSSLKSLVQIGALTPEQAGNSIKNMQSVVDIARDHVQMFGKPDATAQDYHTVTSSPLNNNVAANANSPINENTGWMTNYYNSDRSFQGVLSDISNNRLPNPEVFDSLKPAQRERAILSMEGTRFANGLINSGAPIPQIAKTYEDLERKGRVLSYREQGVRNTLGVFLGRVNNRDYLDAIGNTPAGSAIIQNFVSKNAALDSLQENEVQGVKDPGIIAKVGAKYNALKMQNKNEMVNQAISYGYGAHFPPDKIQPIPSTDVSILENSMKVGQDPSSILQLIGQYNLQNRPWLAQSLKNPRDQVVVNTVGMVGQDIKPSDQLDYIASNQQGRDYTKVNETQEKSKLSDVKINGLLATQPKIKDALDLINVQYDPYKAQTIQAELIKSGLNFVKYLAAKNNDLAMSNKDQYITQAANLMASAYPKASNTNYIANPRQLNLTPTDMDTLANYAVNQGYNFLREGVKESVFFSAADRNQLKMTLSPTNEVMAIDGNNKVYWHAPFSPNLIAAARAYNEQQTKDAEKLQKEMNTMRYGNGALP